MRLKNIVQSYPVSIFMAGDYVHAVEEAQRFCDKRGMCVTVEPCVYVYTGGREDGVRVGLINYPRFPADAGAIQHTARDLAHLLREALGQESFTIETPEHTYWYSWRDAEDGEGR